MIARKLISIAVLLAAVSAEAANKNVGTSGAQFLKIGAGARSTAMGEAFVGVADDANAVYFNPAGLTNMKQIELTAMRTQWIEGIDYNFGALAFPTKIGAFGISAVTLQTDELQRTGSDEASLGTFENIDTAYAVSYGRSITETISAGITGRYILQKIDSTTARTLGADVGLFKRFNNSPTTIGFAIRHFGQKVEFQEESDPLPLTLDLGMGTRFFSDRLLLSANVQKPRDNDVQYGVGSEWKQTINDRFNCALRAGYSSLYTDADSTGVTIGAGMGYRQFNLDFGWVPFGDLGNTFRYSAGMKF